MQHHEALTELANSIRIPLDLTLKFRQLRAGVDYTQNSNTLDAHVWTAARDAAAAFEALEGALQRLDDQTIPF